MSKRRGGFGGNYGRRMGGLSETKLADSSAREIAEEVRQKVLQHLQSSNTPQNVYNVVSYATRVVTGTIYIIKIKINTNPPTFIHVKVLQNLDGTKELSGVESGYNEDDPIVDF